MAAQAKVKKSQIFRSSCIKWGEEKAEEKWSDLTDIQRARFLTLFYVKEVYSKLYPGTVPEADEDLEYCLVDGAYDDGCDFIYRQNNKVVIIQSKYKGKAANQDVGEIEHFRTILPRLHPQSNSKAKQNEYLSDVVSEIDWIDDSFELIFVSLGKLSEEGKKSVDLGIENSSAVAQLGDISERAELNFLDETNLNEQFRNVQSLSLGIVDNIHINFAKRNTDSPWLKYKAPAGRSSYIGIVNAGQLHSLVKQHRLRLFNLNIRNYVGDTKTNKDIIHTAVEDPDDFYFFNNGITAVATHVEEDFEAGKLTMQDFSIINGAQTVRSIAKARGKSETAADANVLIRITEVSYKTAVKEELFLENITRYNNTQNSIKISDFRSNDLIQRSLVQRFDNVTRGGKKYKYKNKRTGGDRTANTIPISMELFAKTVHSYFHGPVDYFGGTNYLFDVSKSGGYCKIFGDGEVVFEELNSNEFDYIAGGYFICEYVSGLHKTIKAELLDSEELQEEDKLIVKVALQQKWMVYFMVGELLRFKLKRDDAAERKFIGSFADPKWLDGDDDKQHLITGYTDAAVEVLMSHFRHWSSTSKFTQRTWFQKPDVLVSLKSEPAKQRFLVKGLPDLT